MADAPAPVTTSPKVNKKIAIVLAVLVMAGAAVGLWYKQANKPEASQEQTSTAVADVMTEDDKVAIAQLSEAYRNAATDEGKAQAASYLAVRYSAIDNHKAALQYFQRAYALGLTDINVILGVAHEAEATDNKAVAIEFYQKAIDYYEAQAETEAIDNQLVIDTLEDRISSLE